MLTLTITDPHLLNEDERQAVLTFAKIRRTPAVIAHDDRPDVGFVIPIASQMKTLPAGLPPPPSPTPPVPPAVDELDPAKVFGGAAASGVPLPPPIPTPPAASAVPPASALPSAPAATAAVPPAGVELDARGLPWDTRIHASTKGRNADGAWKKKKNVEPATITTVETELRALLGIPIAPPPTDAMNEDTPPTFPALMAWVSKLVAEGKLTQAHVVEVVQPIGLQSVVGLGNRPDLIPQVHAQLKAKVAAMLGA